MNYFRNIKRTNSFEVTVYDDSYSFIEFNAQVESQPIFDDSGNAIGIDIYCGDQKGYKCKAEIKLVFSQFLDISSKCSGINNGIYNYKLNSLLNENTATVNNEQYCFEIQLIKSELGNTVDFIFTNSEHNSIILEFSQETFANLTDTLVRL